MAIAFLNGRPLAAGEKGFDLTDRGFTLGDGVFETIPFANRQLIHLDRHLARLAEGLGILGIPAPVDLPVQLDLALNASENLNGIMRLTVSRGQGARGITPPAHPELSVAITLAPFFAARPSVTAIIARSTRRNEHSPLSRIKSLNYGDNILARMEAQQARADDAIMLNTMGSVACATSGNVFCKVAMDILTPPVKDGALPGVARALLLEAGVAREDSISPEMLCAPANIVFITNSLGLSAVAVLDGNVLGHSDLFDTLRCRFWQVPLLEF